MASMIPKHWVDAYVDELADRARNFRDYGDERGAKMVEIHAAEVRARRAAFENELISIAEAAAISGYSAERLRELRRSSKWSGRRGDLPRHPSASAVVQVLSDEELNESGSIADRIAARRHQALPRRTG